MGAEPGGILYSEPFVRERSPVMGEVLEAEESEPYKKKETNQQRMLASRKPGFCGCLLFVCQGTKTVLADSFPACEVVVEDDMD